MKCKQNKTVRSLTLLIGPVSYILFVCVIPVRTSNLEQACSTSVVAFSIFPILSANNNNNNRINQISANSVNDNIQPNYNFDEKQV